MTQNKVSMRGNIAALSLEPRSRLLKKVLRGQAKTASPLFRWFDSWNRLLFTSRRALQSAPSQATRMLRTGSLLALAPKGAPAPIEELGGPRWLILDLLSLLIL